MIWKDIPGFDGYKVSSTGEVKSYRRYPEGKLLKHNIAKDKGGHHFVVLYRNGKTCRRSVHSLVLLTFVGPRPQGLHGLHRDDDPDNNHVDNLFWGTPKRNVRMSIISGRHHSCKLRKLTIEQVRAIRSSTLSYRKLAAQFNVSHSTIKCVRNRTAYADVA